MKYLMGSIYLVWIRCSIYVDSQLWKIIRIIFMRRWLRLHLFFIHYIYQALEQSLGGVLFFLNLCRSYKNMQYVSHRTYREEHSATRTLPSTVAGEMLHVWY